MSSRVQETRPPYPVYEPTPIFGGDLPTIDEIGPPDLRPSSQNPAYSVYAGTRGRNFAGLGESKMNTQSDSADEGVKDYPNELSVLAEADDVSGNGVFDPHGSPGNIHPDYGVFADKESMPGYLMREQFYAPSEVTDLTTGNPVMYVPGGAVPIDQAQADTYRARQLLNELQPGLSPETFGAPAWGSTWVPTDYAMPIAGLGQDLLVGGSCLSLGPCPAGMVSNPSGTMAEGNCCVSAHKRTGMFLAFAAVGLGLGIVAASVARKRRRS